jgi:hypothetical protein
VCLGLSLGACGFTARHTLGPDRPSLGIEIFSNDGREPDLERRLHGELTRAARRMVDANIVAPSQARITLSGRIVEYSTRGGVRGKDNVLLERGVRLTIEGTLRDAQGRRVAGPVSLRQDVGHTTSEPGGRNAAESRALANLAESLLLDLLVDLEQRRDKSL